MGLAIAGIAVLVAVVVIVLLVRGGDKPGSGDSKGKSQRNGSRNGSRNGHGKSTGASASAGKGTATPARQKKPAPGTPYAAVSAQPGMNACDAMLEIAKKRYLEGDAPDLPLAGCDKAHCHCKFTHHDDRRSEEDDDRRVGFGLQSELYGTGGESNRRKKRGRRRSDI